MERRASQDNRLCSPTLRSCLKATNASDLCDGAGQDLFPGSGCLAPSYLSIDKARPEHIHNVYKPACRGGKLVSICLISPARALRYQSIIKTRVIHMSADALISNKYEDQIKSSLDKLAIGLTNKQFTFVVSELSQNHMQERLTKFDEQRLGLGGKLFCFIISGTDMPDFVKIIAKNVIGFGAGKVDDEQLQELQEIMRRHFPLCAFSFSRLYGPRFVAVLNGQEMSEDELNIAINNFEEINLYMMHLGGRLELKLFGKSIIGLNGSGSTGSLIIIAPDSRCSHSISQWLAKRPIHNDTIINQMKERFTRWQFWTKLAVGMIEYKPNQLRQEVIVIDAQTASATSTASPRLNFEFGFALTDIATV